jgi:hypothetical protein
MFIAPSSVFNDWTYLLKRIGFQNKLRTYNFKMAGFSADANKRISDPINFCEDAVVAR